ncbi:MAG: cache domain-containing protein, partial [Proteobacteria bacterium]|nr:cache domain-containing protein [Pseudomonadota bacterium]
MKPKLIGLFLLIGLIPMVLGGWQAGNLATKALMKKSFEELEAVRQIKKHQVETYFAQSQSDLRVLVETVSTLRKEALAKLEAVQEIKKAQVENYFSAMESQLHVMKDDENVLTALTAFNQAFETAGNKVGTSQWEGLAQQYDPRMKDIMADNGWSDLYLIHTDGDIVYTVNRQSDLGMIIPESDLKAQGIGKAFEQAKTMGNDEIALADLAPYSPANGLPAAFMMARMQDPGTGELKGYVAFQIPLDRINAIMFRRNGMGETGESYLVGQDGFMRSDSFLDPEKHSVAASFKNKIKVETEAAKSGLAGKDGQQVIKGYAGNLVVSCWDTVDLGEGIRWAMISEVAVIEAFSPKNEAGSEYYDQYARKYGYSDLFLINPDGLVFYSVGKEADLNSNLARGKYASSNLGRLFRSVLETKRFGLADFEPYAPSNGEPSAFMAQPLVNDQGRAEVVVALQLPLKAINAIMTGRTGMGDTGETYLVGPDKLMRSDSFLDPEHHSVAA